MKQLLPEYETKIKELKKHMFKAQDFAKKLPCMADYIIKNMTAEAEYNQLGTKYKELPFSWGLYRTKYGSELSRKVTNLTGHYDEVILTHIHINTYSLFRDGNTIDLPESITCYFFDKLNRTYYATDDQLENVLEALNAWYKESLIKNKNDFKLRQIEKAERELQRLKDSK